MGLQIRGSTGIQARTFICPRVHCEFENRDRMMSGTRFVLNHHSCDRPQSTSPIDLTHVVGPAISRESFKQETFARQLREMGIMQGPQLKRKRTVKEEASGHPRKPSNPANQPFHQSASSSEKMPLPDEYFIEDDSACEEDYELSYRAASETTQVPQRQPSTARPTIGTSRLANLDNQRFIGRNGESCADATRSGSQTDSLPA